MARTCTRAYAGYALPAWPLNPILWSCLARSFDGHQINSRCRLSLFSDAACPATKKQQNNNNDNKTTTVTKQAVAHLTHPWHPQGERGRRLRRRLRLELVVVLLLVAVVVVVVVVVLVLVLLLLLRLELLRVRLSLWWWRARKRPMPTPIPIPMLLPLPPLPPLNPSRDDDRRTRSEPRRGARRAKKKARRPRWLEIRRRGSSATRARRGFTGIARGMEATLSRSIDGAFPASLLTPLFFFSFEKHKDITHHYILVLYPFFFSLFSFYFICLLFIDRCCFFLLYPPGFARRAWLRTPPEW
jgi:hypothetical protein